MTSLIFDESEARLLLMNLNGARTDWMSRAWYGPRVSLHCARCDANRTRMDGEPRFVEVES